jgi:stage III sporulation protein AB
LTAFAVRFAGAALLAACGYGAGREAATRARRRVAEVRSLEAALRVLASEVAFALTPLAPALRRAGRVAGGEVGALLAAVAAAVDRDGADPETAWRVVLERWRARLAARPEDLEAMAELAASLGRSDREDQEGHVRRAAVRLGTLADRLAPEAERSARVFGALGLLGGLAAAILVL